MLCSEHFQVLLTAFSAIVGEFINMLKVFEDIKGNVVEQILDINVLIAPMGLTEITRSKDI